MENLGKIASLGLLPTARRGKKGMDRAEGAKHGASATHAHARGSVNPKI